MNWASENGLGAQLKRRYDSAPFDGLTRLQVARLQVVYKFAGGLLDFIGLQAIYLLRTNLSLAFQYCFIRH